MKILWAEDNARSARIARIAGRQFLTEHEVVPVPSLWAAPGFAGLKL